MTLIWSDPQHMMELDFNTNQLGQEKSSKNN